MASFFMPVNQKSRASITLDFYPGLLCFVLKSGKPRLYAGFRSKFLHIKGVLTSVQ
jgi:hypothetical protein